MTTPPLTPGRPEDHDDPTGVRALLAGLGDPGPMPANLVDRINASIAAEQLSRSAAGAGAGSYAASDGRSGRVVALRRRQTSWPSWPKIGLAAAAVAAVAIGVPAMLGTGPGGVVASLSSSDNNASDSAGSAPKGEVAPDAGNRAASGTGAVRLAASGTAYTSGELSSQARGTIDRAPAAGAGSDAPAGSAATTERGLRECLTALGVATWMPVTGDVGTYDGRPAVVAVVSSDTGQSVYAVAPDCDATHPAVMAGPVPLG